MLVVGVSVVGSADGAAEPYEVAWTRQLGTSENDYSYSVALDASGNAFISGRTYGSLGGANKGSTDAFLAKYDPAGNLLWTEQLGTSSLDYSNSVAVDASGNAFISGATYGSLGAPYEGEGDAFLAKYGPGGNLLWTEQLGTSALDRVFGVTADGWGNVFVSGGTYGNLGATNEGEDDAFLAKYDPAGDLLWIEQLGTSDIDYCWSVAVDGSGNAFISGSTYGSLGGANEGRNDAFLAKYDPGGSLLWTEQLGTSEYDYSHSVAVDAGGNAFISGLTYGSLGETHAGDWDAFLAKYDSTGNRLWTEQLGTSDLDYSWSIAVDASGNAFISGTTWESLGGTNAGGADAFLVKFVVPCSFVLAGDLDDNCKVDLADFAVMVANWLIDCNADSTNPACLPIP